MCTLRLFVYFDTSLRIEVFTFKVILNSYNCQRIPCDFLILGVAVLGGGGGGKTLMGKTRLYTPSPKKNKKTCCWYRFFFILFKCILIILIMTLDFFLWTL